MFVTDDARAENSCQVQSFIQDTFIAVMGDFLYVSTRGVSYFTIENLILVFILGYNICHKF